MIATYALAKDRGCGFVVPPSEAKERKRISAAPFSRFGGEGCGMLGWDALIFKKGFNEL